MKQGKNSWALMKLLIGTLFLAILLPALSHTETEMDKKYGGIWKDRLDEKTPVSDLYPPIAPPSLRKAAQKEITNLRDEVEDELRMYLLALYWDEKKVEKIKPILNNPWDKEGIEFLWKDIFEDTYDCFKRIMLVDLLIYVDTKYKDETITKIVRGKIDGLFEKMLQNPKSENNQGWAWVWNNLNQAIAKYGSPDFVSPAMWKYVEKAKGDWFKSVLEIFKLHPSEKGINQLKAFVKDVSWEKDDKRRGEIEETIKLVESLLRYPVVQILMSYNQYYAKIIIARADEMKGTQEERIKFLEQEVDKYADSLVEVAKDQNRFIRDREKDIQEAQEIKAKLKEFREKNKSK